MKKYILSALFTWFIVGQVISQSPILFNYGDQNVLKSEFERVFMKNNQKDKKPDAAAVNEYLDLYINFKLKVKEARSLGLDTMPSFKKELEGYRKQLAQPYLTDKSVNENLIREAYERSKLEINASHILIICDENALPKDTQIAYNKLAEIRKKIMNGEMFDSAASQSSEDPSAKFNHGNLGYFTVFNLIYSFENYAYNTPKGEVSQIFRTKFGYHILKVIDRRPARADIKVAHIMLKIGKDKDANAVAKVRIDSIYQRLLNGANFEEMVKQYSEDEGTVKTGGVLNYIASIGGPWPIEFKDAAFSIKNIGGYAPPLETPYGFHIIRLVERKEIPTFDQQKDQLKQKITRDQRSEINKMVVIERIKKEYNFKEVPKAVEVFYNADSASFNKDLAAGKWNAMGMKVTNKSMFSLGDKNYTEEQFKTYVTDYQSPRQRGNSLGMLMGMYKDFINQKCVEYEESKLETKFEDFKNLFQEYKEGILLFELMDKKVWSKAQTDTTGLKEFYEINKNNYMWKDRADAQFFECNDAKTAKLIKKMMKKNISSDSILKVVNKVNPLNATVKQGKFEKGENAVLDSLGWKQGLNIYTNEAGKNYIVNIKEIITAQPKKLTESRGMITADYQSYLEKQWIAELKQKYPVSVNAAVKETLFR
ncbi:MAG: peptidylprolyl isomerase [Bacteroidetes bacterium]|nr:peptidylprolyl isomerase [Bacteroidota bacterium]